MVTWIGCDDMSKSTKFKITGIKNKEAVTFYFYDGELTSDPERHALVGLCGKFQGAVGGTYYLKEGDILSSSIVVWDYLDEVTSEWYNGDTPMLPCRKGAIY